MVTSKALNSLTLELNSWLPRFLFLASLVLWIFLHLRGLDLRFYTASSCCIPSILHLASANTALFNFVHPCSIGIGLRIHVFKFTFVCTCTLTLVSWYLRIAVGIALSCTFTWHSLRSWFELVIKFHCCVFGHHRCIDIGGCAVFCDSWFSEHFCFKNALCLILCCFVVEFLVYLHIRIYICSLFCRLVVHMSIFEAWHLNKVFFFKFAVVC